MFLSKDIYSLSYKETIINEIQILERNAYLILDKNRKVIYNYNVVDSTTNPEYGYVALNNKAYMLTARCAESRRLKKVPITTSNFLPTL